MLLFMKSRQDSFKTVLAIVFTLAVCGYAVLIAISTLPQRVNEFDDAIPLLHGQLIERGYTPNIDFYSFYPPLTPYLNAAIFKLLGKTVIGPRLVADFFLIVVLVLTGWHFSTTFHSSPLVPLGVLVVAASIGTTVSIASWPGFALCLISLLLYLCSHNAGRARVWLVAASGVVAALTTLCRINFGGYVVFIVGIDMFLEWLSYRQDAARSKTAVTTIAAFAAPLAIFATVFSMLVYGRQIGMGISDFVITAQRVMAVRGFLPLRFKPELAVLALPCLWFLFRMLNGSTSFSVRAYIPAAAAAGLVAMALLGRRSLMAGLIVVAIELGAVILMHLYLYRLERSEFCVLLLFCCLLHYYVSRADRLHWRLLPIICAMLLPYLVIMNYESVRNRLRLGAGTGTALAILSAALFVFVDSDAFRPFVSDFPQGLSVLRNVLKTPTASDSNRVVDAKSAGFGWETVYPDPEEIAALKFLRERTAESTPLFVGVEDHSAVFNNNLRTYWLADRPIAVRTFQLEEKIATLESVQQEIVADLERNKNAWVILKCMTSESARSSEIGSKLLDNYIAADFRTIARFGCYRILARPAD
jgi:hypothetical protein